MSLAEPPPEPAENAPEPALGAILVREGLISEVQLQAALAIQGELGTYKPIGQILVAQQALTQRQLDYVLSRHQKRSRLGDILVRTGVVTQDQLQFALGQQKETGLRLGDVLLRLGFIGETALRRALCTQLNVPFIDLDAMVLDPALAKLVNKHYAKHHRVVPVAKIDHSMTVAMDDPADAGVVEELQLSTGCTVNVVTSTREAFLRAFARVYEGEGVRPAESRSRLEFVKDEPSPQRWRANYTVESRQADELVRELLGLAIRSRATDIHLESLDNRISTRLRVDGVLHELSVAPMDDAINLHQREIISRIKILGNLDIAERRRPQDGSFRARVVEGTQVIKVNLRISVIPGYYGESVVLRILDPRNAPTSTEQLGFSHRVTERLKELLQRTTGILLITGPTGSGKSTTLYAALMALYRPGIRILSAEDPIEYVYDHLSQSEVNEKIGNTFANYLRAFLRHDPEVIMIGEIRDAETAEMAFRAAQTGHLLLSTMHTTDAVGSVTRLRDLGVDSNLITSCLIGAMSQRLVRTVCAECREAYTPSDEILREFFDEAPIGIQWQRGRGCPECKFTGYRGRMPVAELWVPNERDVRLINKGAPFEEIQQSARETTVLMAEDVREKLVGGRTTLDELIRTLPYASIYQFRRLRDWTVGAELRGPVPA